MPRSHETASRRRRRGPGMPWLSMAPWLLLLPVALTGQAQEAEPPTAAASGDAGTESPEARPVEYSSPYAAWDAGAYDEALRGFADRQTERPEDPELSLNVGAAHYRLNEFDEADSQFYRAAAVGDDDLRAQALYNLGNSAYRQGKLEDAVDFYAASLEANPEDLDAKFNLEFVREEMRQRQQDQQQNQEQDGEDEQQEDQDQQDQQEQQEQQEQAPQQQPEGNEGEEEQPSGQQQDQDQDEEGQDQQPQGGESPRDSDGDGIPDSEDPTPQGEGEEGGDEGRPQAPPPGMTPEEAERYLQALEEGRPDPTRRGQRGRRSRLAKDW